MAKNDWIFKSTKPRRASCINVYKRREELNGNTYMLRGKKYNGKGDNTNIIYIQTNEDLPCRWYVLCLYLACNFLMVRLFLFTINLFCT